MGHLDRISLRYSLDCSLHLVLYGNARFAQGDYLNTFILTSGCPGLYLYHFMSSSLLAPSAAIAVGTALNAVRTVTTLFAFILIVGRLVYVRHRVTRLMKGTICQPSRDYTSLMGILVESYALAAIVTLGNTISWATYDYRKPAELVFNGVASQTQTIERHLDDYLFSSSLPSAVQKSMESKHRTSTYDLAMDS
ncbi:hypothetical protein D9756_011497 [Leucocoprinus leucothites]|uniref:Uncharacterized protein n=1 Tax=Leucocoprinus leucothites TaxID=201217 RepID=A0A8H5FQ25_9AGAR|nr:hypothetical protein D9756_011497 [Leucoagaricus leucothites]